MNSKIEGWPDTDPFPYRGVTGSARLKEPPDCDYVTRDKEYAKSESAKDLSSYSQVLAPAWQYINELHQQVEQLKEHIEWLRNVGGERLNMACGVDIVSRGLIFEKRESRER